MPLYTNVARGNLIINKDKIVKPGKQIEMSKEEADSLPPGTVEIVKAEPKKPEGKQ